jgi:predicted RNA-binding Zn ribbon-like protein
MSIKASNLTLLGGAPCLDFVNTRTWNDREPPHDFFAEYENLLQWGLQQELVTARQAEQLADTAERKSSESLAILEQARTTRAAIYRIFFAIAESREIPPADLDFFNRSWKKALGGLQVQKDRKSFQWNWVNMEGELGSILWPVLHSVAELLVSEKLDRIKDCQGCGWLFLDTTRSGRRRWCDMSVCGNREKARRHYARARKIHSKSKNS